MHFVRHISLSSVSIGLHGFFQKRHNSIKLCWNKSKKLPRLNNDERNKAIGMLNAGMSATVVSPHFGCTQKTIKRLRRWFRVTGNIANCPQSGRPHVTTAADDCYIVFQNLRNRCLTAAPTGRQCVFIHRLLEIGTLLHYGSFPFTSVVGSESRQSWRSIYVTWPLLIFI